jgi:hypothetical protein
MASIIMAVIMGGLGGPALAWALGSPKNRKGYADRKAKFEAGQGPDPDKAPFGPHKPFATNALFFGAIFAAVGFVIGTMA